MNYERRHDVEVPDDLDAWALAEHAEASLRRQLDGRLFIAAKNDRGEAQGATVGEVRSDLNERTHTTTRIYMAIYSADNMSHDTVMLDRRSVTMPWKCSVFAEGPDLTRVKGSASVLEDGVVDWVAESKQRERATTDAGASAQPTYVAASLASAPEPALPAKQPWWRIFINHPWTIAIGAVLLGVVLTAIFLG